MLAPSVLLPTLWNVPYNTSLFEMLQRPVEFAQYTSENFQELLKAQGITCSMSRRGSGYDNARCRELVSTLKAELGERFESHAGAKGKLF